MIEIIKNCRKCGPLQAHQIYKNRKCITCSKEYALNWPKLNQRNADKRKETAKKWKKNNPEKVKQYRDHYNTEKKLINWKWIKFMEKDITIKIL